MEVLQSQMIMCIEDFNFLVQQNNYISKKNYDAFVDKYEDVFQNLKFYDKNSTEYIKIMGIAQNGYKLIENKNKEYINRSLIIYKDYFDNLFKDIDSNILLDEEQRKAILIDEDYSLIVAGAGSGKTTTIVAKVKFLVDIKKIKPNEIVLLAFNNKVADELNDLLNNKFKLGVEALTFHKLGMRFVRGIFDKPVKVIHEFEIKSILSDYFKLCVFKNKKMLEFHIKYFGENLKRISQYSTWKYFDNYDEYYNNYTNLEYEKFKNQLDKENKLRIKARTKIYKTINGEFVKSKGEVEIANYLYRNGIPYTYEKVYPFYVGNLRSYAPDFTIYLDEKDIYVEFYGLASLNKDGIITCDDEKYLREIDLKRKKHFKNKTDLIDIYGKYEENDAYYLKNLAYELTKRGVIKNKKSDKEIFYRLMETSKESLYWSLILLFYEFITTFKELNFSDDKFEELIQFDDDILKGKFIILKNVYHYYNNRIHSNYLIDFADMINYSYRYMEYARNNQKMKYKYVFVDEYQDISNSRFNLVKKLADLFHSKVVAVGDDWQSIYSFSGSDIELFTHFFELMGYGEIIKITKTYRNSQELIDVAGDFILQNKMQIEKRLVSDKHLDSPIQLVNYICEKYSDGFIESNFVDIVEKLVCFLYKSNPDQKILLLGRFNDDIDALIESKRFYFKNLEKGLIISNKCPKANLTFLTAHSSKGLGFDQVILLNGLNMLKGFPSKIQDDMVIQYLKKNVINCGEDIEYPEERRLFYVAMTRTKQYLFIMVPNLFELKSDFVKELSLYDNVKEFAENNC